MSASLEPDQQKRQAAELAQKWLSEITRVRGKEKKWREQAQKVIDRYRDDRSLDSQAAKFNILWSNTEVIKPAIFSRMPVPDVRRRWTTKDAAARTAALILERALSFVNSSFDFKDVLVRANDDYVLPGRAMAVVCYEPLILQRPRRQAVEPLPPSDPPEDPKYPDGTEFDAQGAFQLQPEEYKAWESVYVEYVPWQLFGFSECKQWSKCPAVWIGEYLARADIEQLAPAFTDFQGLSFKESSDDEGDKDKHAQPPQTVLVWKIWHKAARKFLVVADGYSLAPLLIMDDPTQLERFYPLPEPMYSLRTNGNWTPKPEFLLYQDQALELDIIAERMRALIQACKNRGVYDQAMDQLAQISELPKKGDNEFIPVANFSQLAEKGGLEGLIAALPLQQIVEVIAQLREREQELKAQIYEIYGIADIMRGASQASETLGAQQLKAQYGALRISTRQERFQEFVRDLYRIEAELIAEHFDAETLRIMTGLEVIPEQQFAQLKQQNKVPAGAISDTEFAQALHIIRSDKLRGFKVDIETDSTIPVDKQSEQQNRVAFMQAIGQYLQGVIPAVQSGAIPASVAREAMLFVVRGFKVGSELEEVLEEIGQDGDSGEQLAKLQQVVQQLQQQLQTVQQENQTLKADTAVEMQKADSHAQIAHASAAQAAQLKDAEAQQSMQLAQQQAEFATQLKLKQAEHAQGLSQQQAEFDMQLKLKAEAGKQAEQAQGKQQTADTMAKEDLKFEALLQGQQQIAAALNQLSAAMAHIGQPRKRSGSAKLSDGRVINLEMMDS